MPSPETPRLSFLNIAPEPFAFDWLARQIQDFDQYIHFIQDLSQMSFEPALGYAGNNYLHISARYPQVFKLILDQCPKDELATELGKKNYFGENVLHFACVKTESLTYALDSLKNHLLQVAIDKKQRSYNISKLVLSPTAYAQTLFETACIVGNASALEYLISLYSPKARTEIIQKLSTIKVITGQDQTYLDTAMQNEELKALFMKYLPQASSSSYFFADIPESTSSMELQRSFSPVFI